MNLDQLQKAMEDMQAEMEAMDDALLMQVAAIGASGRVQILPRPPSIFWEDGKMILVMPEAKYERMLKLLAKNKAKQDASQPFHTPGIIHRKII